MFKFYRMTTTIAVALNLFLTAAAVADPLELPALATQTPSMALQGYSGIINTPTGHVQQEGTFHALYSNQIDERWRNKTSWQDNYLFSVGLFNFVEIGGRLTSNVSVRDLSANAKITTAPFTRDMPYIPVLALGIQDVGGGANYLRTTYLALSEDIWRLRLSAGYGKGPDRMKGGFGGVELKAHDWVYLLGENDTKDTNAGVRLIAPPLPLIPASLTFTAKTALNRSSNLDIAFGLTLPLDMKQKTATADSRTKTENVAEKRDASIAKTVNNKDSDLVVPAPAGDITAPSNTEKQLSSIRSQLIDAGFVNVQTGTINGNGLVVEYENVRYNHNELDAMGVVAGIASSTDLEGIETLWLVVKRKGLRMLVVSTSLKDMQKWLSSTKDVTVPSLQVTNNTSAVDKTIFIKGDCNSDWLRPSISIFPGLKTFVGTEVGVFDYLLSLKPELQMTTWKGGVLNARWDLPVAWSENLKNHHQFAYARNQPMMDRLMFFQGISLAPGIMANLGGGMILNDINGTLNELTWSPGSGTHRFRAAQAYARNDENRDSYKVLLGSYRIYLASLDLFLEGTAGRFWGQDTGGLLSVKRFFGDTAVDLYYKNTETQEDKRWQAAGIQFSFPLTPRRDMKRSPLQVRGTEEWSYAQESVLAINGQRTNDTVSFGLGVNPLPSSNIYRSYLNRDRLNEDYILTHKQRLKEAWYSFRGSLASPLPMF